MLAYFLLSLGKIIYWGGVGRRWGYNSDIAKDFSEAEIRLEHLSGFSIGIEV